MKKLTFAALFTLLTMLLVCTAYAEDGHNWKWKYTDNAHVRYCDGCETHSDMLIDKSSSEPHTYKCEWPESEPANPNAAYIDIVCECGKRENVQVMVQGGRNPTCTTQGMISYAYKGTFNVPQSDKTKDYVLPVIPHEFQNYTRNNDAACLRNETETAECEYARGENPKCTATDTREIPNSMLGHDLKTYPAKTAGCTESGYEAYEACTRCDYTTYKEIPATGHNYITETVKPTCKKRGYTAHVCTLCGDTSIVQTTAARSHWYGEWIPNAEEDTHTAECRRSGCGYKKTVACASVACKLIADDQTAKELTLCPVCGRVSDGTRLTLVEYASAEADFLPRGEVLVRMGNLADGNQLMVVGFEFAGRLTQAQCPVKVSLPAELLDGCILHLVYADGTESDLPFSVQDGIASFTLDFTDAQSPVQLIHILSAQ